MFTNEQLHHINEAGIHPQTAPSVRQRPAMQFAGKRPKGDSASVAAKHLDNAPMAVNRKFTSTQHGIVPPHKVLNT